MLLDSQTDDAVAYVEQDGFAQIVRKYADLWGAYERTGYSKVTNPLDVENGFDAPWKLPHYFSTGQDALRIIVSALVAAQRKPPKKILDFPSGSGRLTRHLRAMFPDSEIGACDLYDDHFNFCAEQFGATPLQSSDGLDDLDIGKWDLIFSGSLLTHLPLQQFRAALRFMMRSLSPGGIAVVTLEGRHALHIQDHKWKFIDDEAFAIAREQYDRTGFGFVGYGDEFMGKFQRNSSYGVTLVKPSWIMDELCQTEDVRVLGLEERAWDDHQDVVIFGKPGVNA